VYVPHWWRRALEDGSHCEAKRRERWFIDYSAAAESDLSSAGLLPVELIGPFTVLYRRGFRLGYDNAKLKRERDQKYWPKRRKRAKLGK
jgi:hypothetical protein